jgi:Ca-activated chloride channel family protein
MIVFEWPWIFVLLPLPWLIRRLLPPVTDVQQSVLHTPFIEDFADGAATGPGASTGLKYLLPLAVLCWLLLLAAAARPQWLGEPVELPVSGRDLMLSIDLSGSMQEEDFIIKNSAIDRLTAVKYVAGEFIARRNGDRIGLILFGERAYVQTPLTFDRQTVQTLLREAFIGMAGDRTAIGDSIGLAIKRLRQQSQGQPQQRRVLIHMTDGANTAGELSPIKAAELAAEAGLKIYTIGIGSNAMQRRSFFGTFMRNPASDLDEATLKAIAEKTGGRYFRAHDTRELEEIYKILDQLEPTEVETQSFRPTRALFYWPLSLAFAVFTIILAGYAVKSS